MYRSDHIDTPVLSPLIEGIRSIHISEDAEPDTDTLAFPAIDDSIGDTLALRSNDDSIDNMLDFTSNEDSNEDLFDDSFECGAGPINVSSLTDLRIFGGQPAVPYSWPFVVFLLFTKQ